MSKTLRHRRIRLRARRARRARLVTALVIGGIAATVGCSWALYDYLKDGQDWPSIKTLKPERIGENSIVYAADGSRMGIIQSDQNRTIVSFRDMGKWAPKAAVAIEDRRFYQHNGVDPEGVMRAALRNYEAGSTVEGASTITQQVVRNLYKEIDEQKTLSRKAKEATLSIQLEKEWSKHRILETYLNIVFFGNNAYGIEAAAQTYFSKSAKDLTLPDAALLAGLPQQPSRFDPFHQPKPAIARRNTVLEAMYTNKAITKAQYTKAVAAPLNLSAGQIYEERRLPYFFDYVEKQLISQYDATTVRQGGLRIYTTISPRLQNLAETSLRETLNQPGDPSAAMVVIDTRTGAIKAMASKENYTRSQFNRAAQAMRQPGSTAKVWVLADFVRNNVDPNSTYYTSRPLKIRYVGSTEWWEPKTYSNTYGGSMSIASATVRSDNSVYAQMSLDAPSATGEPGPAAVARTAHQLGIFSPLQHVWSIGLGSQVVTPLEQTNFYATIARGGTRIDPRAVKYLTGPSGQKVLLKYPEPKRVMRDWQAKSIVDILTTNMQAGTGTGAQIGRLAAGKTGTTDDAKDAWFCGMTPELTACVWMGYNEPTPMYSVHGSTVAGGTFPATMWRRFMEPALDGKSYHPWFTVKGTAAWESFTSTWQNNMGIDIAIGRGALPTTPDPEEKPKDKQKGDDDSATTPAPGTTPPPEPSPAPAPQPTPGPVATPAPAPAVAPAPAPGSPPPPQ